MYTCIIADDHLVERDLLKLFIEKIPSLQLIAECKDGFELSTALHKQSADFVFSDIDMPGLSGIDLLKSLKNPPIFIFISSFPEYAQESFNLDVVDFMAKPLQFERFLKGVNKAIEYIDLKKLQINSKAITQQENTADTNTPTIAEDYFFIKEAQSFVKIFSKDVLYIESMGDFSKIHTTQKKAHIILVGMKNIEMQLSYKQFLRVHRQYIVNLQHVELVKQAEIQLSGNTVIPVSSAYKEVLLSNLVEKTLLKRN